MSVRNGAATELRVVRVQVVAFELGSGVVVKIEGGKDDASTCVARSFNFYRGGAAWAASGLAA